MTRLAIEKLSPSTGAAVIFEERLEIPAAAHSLSAFRGWVHSDRFPEDGRIDFLAGNIEVDMSPEDLFTHGTVKTTIAAELHALVAGEDLGLVFVDRARLTAPEAGLSAEPDVLVLLWDSLENGHAQLVPAKSQDTGRYVEIQGAADVVVEIVSDGSVRKDTERLPPLYAASGTRELWTVDARGDQLVFEIDSLKEEAYLRQQRDSGGWVRSPALDRLLRLRRFRGRHGSWRYELNARRSG